MKFDSLVYYNETKGHTSMQGAGEDINLRAIVKSLGIPADEDGAIKALQ